MKKIKPHPDALEKMPTGISGFDDITGGLPLRRTTLLMGGPGCGKTVFALQILVKGATEQGAPGIFVAFEEIRGEVPLECGNIWVEAPRARERKALLRRCTNARGRG